MYNVFTEAKLLCSERLVTLGMNPTTLEDMIAEEDTNMRAQRTKLLSSSLTIPLDCDAAQCGRVCYPSHVERADCIIKRANDREGRTPRRRKGFQRNQS